KDPRRRLPHIGVARIEIEEGPLVAPPVAATAIQAAARPLWRRVMPATVAAVVAGALVGAVGWRFKPSAPPGHVTRFPIILPEGQRFTNTIRTQVAISPDGQEMAYIANNRLYLRSMSDLE